MGQERRAPTWFAALRRDRHAFALLCALSLVLALLQPLTALAAGPADGFVICSAHGVATDADAGGSDRSLPVDGPSCPCCFAHLCGGLPTLDKALAASAPAFPLPDAAWLVNVPSRTGLPVDDAGAAQPPPARAPPSA